MLAREYSFQQKINELREREKELRCIYIVEETLHKYHVGDELFQHIIKRMPYGWQYPEKCRVKITFEGNVYREPGWEETEWFQSADIVVDEKVSGEIRVYYTEYRKLIVDTPFLPEEQRLLNSIAYRLGNHIFNERLGSTLEILKQDKQQPEQETNKILTPESDTHWIWRKNMAEKMAEKMNFKRFGVKGFYIIGSTKNANAGPSSDIDLLLHIDQDAKDRTELKAWIEGWSLCLSQINFERTGYHTDGLIDLHLVTDEDIKNKTSFAVKIGAISDAAKLIKSREN
jgi:hypothetical protein